MAKKKSVITQPVFSVSKENMGRKKKSVKKEENSKLLAFVTTFLSIVGFVIALIAWRDKKYVMFYARQSLVVFIVGAIAGIVKMVFIWIPVIGKIISFALGLIVFVLWVVSWVYALSGEMKEVPVVGVWGRKIDL
ncbi:hypothetical protein J4402_04465 [Candidatus Pacearchaeota archaeon]|nr:hypothetical protein [Candidatus Pacearchaeota archaeon]